MAQLGPYDIDEPLGHGAVGRVFGGVHRATGTPVAAKLARGDISPQSSALTSLLQELELITRLDHPAIVAVLDGGYLAEPITVAQSTFDTGTPYMVVERADGTLRDHRPTSWPDVLDLLVRLLDGLAYAHARHVVHRDVKPENVLRVGGSWKLGDFGLGSVYTVRQASPNAGSPQFMAPEQFRGAARDLLPSTDLYAVGGLAYWLVCGRAPFEATNYLDYAQAHLDAPVPPAEPLFDVPPALDRWLACMLAKQQTDRFFRAADALHALQNLHDPASWTPVGAGALLTTTVPPPATWRRDLVQRTDELVAASLSLFGMREPPLVARDSERDQLWNALREVHGTGRARIVVLEGSAGCGKSRLAEWFCQRADEVGTATYMTAFGDPDRGGAGVLMDMAARYLRSTELQPGEARPRARQLLDVYGVDPDWRLDALERLLAETARPDDELELDAGERYGLLWELIETVSIGRPVIVHLDDAHHCVAALEMIHSAFEDGPPQAKVLFVLTVQRDAMLDDPTAHTLLTRLYDLRSTARLLLGELTTSEVRTLLRELLRLENRLAEKLADRVGGNPLFAVQLVADWVAQDALRYEDGQLHLDRAVWPRLPDSIWHVWRERLMRAVGPEPGGEGQHALELAAILGREVWNEDWQGVCRDAEVEPPPRLLEALFASGLARGENRGWTFAHEMLRETLLRTCREAGRWGDFHRIVGDFILAKSSQHASHERLGRAARYFAEARDRRAAELFVEAMERAQQYGDHYFALELHRKLQELDATLVTPDDRLEGDLRATFSILRVGEAAQALDLVQDTLDAARKRGSIELEAEALSTRSRVYCVLGRLHDAADSAKLSVEAFGRAGDVDGLARATLELAEVYGYMSRHQQAIELYREARRHFADRRQPRQLAQTDYGIGYCLQQRGELAGAEPYLQQAYELFTELSAQNDAYGVLVSLGDLARERGDLDLAEERYRACGEFFEATGDAAGMVVYLNLAMVALQREDFDAMRGWTEYGRQLAERHRFESLRAAVHALSLACDAVERDWPAWDQDFAALPVWIAETGALERDDLLVVEEAAELTARAGDHSRAARAFDLVAELSETAGDGARARAAKERARALRG